MIDLKIKYEVWFMTAQTFSFFIELLNIKHFRAFAAMNVCLTVEMVLFHNFEAQSL